MNERELSLSPRLENTRPLQNTRCVKFDLDNIQEYFESDLDSIYSMFELVSTDDENKEINQLIFQAQLVFLESNFDYYLHNITKYGIDRIHERYWNSTAKYNNINIPMETIERVLSNEIDEGWFYEYISGFYSNVTMVSYDSFKAQMNLIGLDIRKIANRAFYDRNSNIPTIDVLKNKINALYNKRNLIAHQFARTHENASKNRITKEEAEQFIEDIKKIVGAIQLEILSMDELCVQNDCVGA